ncbi:FabG-like 3-oxoacyl-(acyl-carrier-protein) reductase [Paraconexibacter sp. AEG42_29]|uniref:FabG-like 3-oxoacyl-(Acyl-carrier-protein) reductase n=1 Tax=Paraconexibacter sp. AEG42_29 TaxID=2997339 RepID=A0AAU7AQV9_9ACTN
MTPRIPGVGTLLGAARAAGVPGLSPTPAYDVAGRVALITGAGQGIGLATARALYARGANVVTVDVDATALAAGGFAAGRSLGIAADVRDRDAMAAAVDAAVARFGALDIVVANAGVVPQPATLRTMDPADYDRVIAINQTGVFNTVHPALESVIAARGHVVVVASVAAFAPGLGGSPYMISKAAVEQLGRALRLELAPHGATCGIASFGVVETGMTRSTLDEDPLGAALQAQLPGPLRRRITAEDAGVVIADGIARRAPRTMAPQAWTAWSLLRGVANVVLDDRVARDPAAHAIVRDIEARAAPARAGT